MRKISNWIKKNRREFIILILVIGIAAFMRLYRIDEYMTFLGDEGRDALIIKRILTTGDIPLIGPPTSVGNMYLGPLYYYMMTLPMALFWLNPVAAAVQVAILGTLSVGLIYYLAREWFGKLAALVASVLYAFSPVNIIYSRSSWNPNPAPFFALILILSLYKAYITKNFNWFILSGIAGAFAVQMHYLALILLPVAGVLWLYQLHDFSKNKKGKNFWKGTFIGITIFLILMSPLLIFDLKHNFVNFKAVQTFFTNRETTVNLNIFNTLERYPSIYGYSLVGRYITGDNGFLRVFVSIILFVPLLISLYLWKIGQIRGSKIKWPIIALYIWMFIGVTGLVLYKQTVYDHYLGFINPAPFLILGSLVVTVVFFKGFTKKIFYGLFLGLVIVLLIGEIIRTPLTASPNNQLKRTQEISRYIIQKSNHKPFNFALISKHNYDAAYQFYLDYYGFKPKELPSEKTDQLFVVCEDEVCKPIGHPKHEIAAFGWAKIAEEDKFGNIRIFKLIHNPQEEVANENKN